ncbi:MAG TPA: SDR family NAD(P)-dependent oxidoreductase [Gaiellaceae bacterium]|nr:SDR family NAD(P)-dependent oxidoreductase [Gaiellaceae bacterium]
MTRVAIVTGAARGLGEAIALRLHSAGYRVALTDLDAAGVRRVAGELGDGALGIEHDVREPDSWEQTLDAVCERLGDEVHVLVNNAARTEFRSFWEIDLDEWDDVLATNLRGTYLGCRVVGAYLRERGSGRIVNVTSDAGQTAGGASGAHYAASKAAIVALTRRAATALAAHGVTVNAVAPAAIDGPLAHALPPAELAQMVSVIPVGRLGWPEEVAALVSFLVSDDAGYVTGATLDINGGMLMR